jgi:hypothetical protein
MTTSNPLSGQNAYGDQISIDSSHRGVSIKSYIDDKIADITGVDGGSISELKDALTRVETYAIGKVYTMETSATGAAELMIVNPYIQPTNEGDAYLPLLIELREDAPSSVYGDELADIDEVGLVKHQQYRVRLTNAAPNSTFFVRVRATPLTN